MKRRTAATVVAMISVFAFATTVPPVSLKERVRKADHIFRGVATEMTLMDRKGEAVTNATNSTSHELGLRITVIPKQVFSTPLKKFPTNMVFTYGQGFFLSVKAERERLLHKEMYFLLSGTAFTPVHALQFCEPTTMQAEIDNLLKDKPIE